MAGTAQISKGKRQSITFRHEGQSIKMSKTLKVSSSAVAKPSSAMMKLAHEDRNRKGRTRVTSAAENKLEFTAPQIESPNKCFRVQVTDTSQHQLFRGDCESVLHGRIAAKKPLLKDTNKRLAWAKNMSNEH
jgi:hypothetical protein